MMAHMELERFNELKTKLWKNKATIPEAAEWLRYRLSLPTHKQHDAYDGQDEQAAWILAMEWLRQGTGEFLRNAMGEWQGTGEL